MIKRLLSLLLLFALVLLSSCGSTSPQAVPDQAGTPPSQESSAEGIPLGVNSALTILSELEDMPEQALFSVIYYGEDVKWMEVNALEYIERYLPMEDGHPYFLVVPRNNGSQITVESSDGTTFQQTNSPDQFALLLNHSYSGQSPTKVLTVEHENKKMTFDFSTDFLEEETPFLQDTIYFVVSETRDLPDPASS